MTGGIWLCTHLWEHYLFTGDREFLKRYYPVMKGSAEFFLDFLVPRPLDDCVGNRILEMASRPSGMSGRAA
jgi:hypothetical protein